MMNNYKILVKVGSGGMADIYKALQTSLDRIVVIKQLKEKYKHDETLVERFIREARIAASLHHQNIAHVYDFWETDDSVAMAMEFIDGMNLYQILRNVSKIPESVVFHIGYLVARAINYAHRRGIIHRDLKPANIMITKGGEIKLMDFGIAKIKHESQLTMPGIYLGTPSYMSPEQVVGREVTFQTDIWSYGAVLYELLTGRKAFSGDETKTVFEAIQKGRYTKPRQINPKISYRTQAIIRRCLQTHPSNRFADFQVIEELFGNLRRGISEPLLAEFLHDHFSYESVASGRASEDIIHTQTFVRAKGFSIQGGLLFQLVSLFGYFFFAAGILFLFQFLRFSF